jgi:hypothetical protein
MILFAHIYSKDLYFIIFLYKKNGCRRSFCVDVYTTKGIRFHEPNRIRFVRINEVLLEQSQDIRIQDHVL